MNDSQFFFLLQFYPIRPSFHEPFSFRMRECALGPRGRRLLALAGSRTAGLKPALNFVPWIVIDGERNSDALYDLTENLCKALEPGPEECAVYEKRSEEN